MQFFAQRESSILILPVRGISPSSTLRMLHVFTNLKNIFCFGAGVTVVKNLQNVQGRFWLTEKVFRPWAGTTSSASRVAGGLSRFLGTRSPLWWTVMTRTPPRDAPTDDEGSLPAFLMMTAPSERATMAPKSATKIVNLFIFVQV